MVNIPLTTAYQFTRITPINREKLEGEIRELGYVGNCGDFVSLRAQVDFVTPMELTVSDEATIQGVIDAHDPVDYVANQRASILTFAKPQFRALRALPPEDAGYALMARILAFNDGASGAVINGIVDRTTAADYVLAKPEWVNLPASAKAWLTDQLDMHAGIYQLLFYLLEW